MIDRHDKDEEIIGDKVNYGKIFPLIFIFGI